MVEVKFSPPKKDPNQGLVKPKLEVKKDKDGNDVY